MADTKITGLTQQPAANVDPLNDLLVTVDVSDTTMASSGTDKKLVIADLGTSLGIIGTALLVGEGWALP